MTLNSFNVSRLEIIVCIQIFCACIYVCNNNFIVQHVRSAESVCRFQIQPKCGAALPCAIMCTLHRIL